MIAACVRSYPGLDGEPVLVGFPNSPAKIKNILNILDVEGTKAVSNAYQEMSTAAGTHNAVMTVTAKSGHTLALPWSVEVTEGAGATQM